jgi:hypothetical protein
MSTSSLIGHRLAGTAPKNKNSIMDDGLPENWQELDYVRGYYEGMRAIGDAVKAGRRELPETFIPRERGKNGKVPNAMQPGWKRSGL